MKRMLKVKPLLFAVLGLLVLGCKKDPAPLVENPEFTKFDLVATSNPGLNSEVKGVIEGKTISLRIPNSVDITKVVPTFALSNSSAIVYVGSEVQQSGTTSRDFSTPVTYRVVSENGSTEYTVSALRNAAILSFGFYAEDNEGVLFRDYVAEISGLNIDIEVPIDADINDLVARFTTTSDATVTVGGTAQVSTTTTNDFTNAVTYTVSDQHSTSPDQFVVTVGRLTAPVWGQVSTSELTEKVSGLRLAIHPMTNAPYVIYSIPSSLAETTADRKAVAAHLDGSTWKFLGSSSGFSPNRVDYVSLAIANDGTVYAAYKDFNDGDDAQHATVEKFENNSWSLVGSRQFSDHRVNHLYISVGDDNEPVIGYVLATASAPLPSRTPFAVQWSNNTWVPRPVSNMSLAYSARTYTGNDGKVYFTGMDMTNGTAPRNPTLLQLNNGTWQTVGTPLISPAEDVYGGILIDAAIASDGNAYVVYQSQANADKKSYVMHYDGSSWQQIGAEIPHTATSSGERDNIALAVHPNGTLFFAHADATGLFVTTFNENSNNWNAVTQLTSERVSGLDLKVSKDGVPYLATSTIEDSKPLVYKFDIPN